MKKGIIILLLLLNFNHSFGQNKVISDKEKIKNIIQTFMDCIETKDSLKMYALFHKGPVTWVGVYKDITQKERLIKDSSALNYKIADYKTWFRTIRKPSPRREDFSNIEII